MPLTTLSSHRLQMVLVPVLACLLSLPASALELMRVRTDPTWAAINNSVNAELDILTSAGNTVSLGLYYTDGWGIEPTPTRRFSPALRIDFHAGDPRRSGWHPNLMLQSDLMAHGDGSYGTGLRLKARQSYSWIRAPLSVTLGIGAQVRTGDRTESMSCYLCPAYEVGLGWML